MAGSPVRAVASRTSLVPIRHGSRGGCGDGAPGRVGRHDPPGNTLIRPGWGRAIPRELFRVGGHFATHHPENFANEYRFRVRGHILVRRTAAATPGQQRQQRAASSRRGPLEDDQGNSG
ncbi:hypothetical protein CFB52_018015 [Burkholderia sp. AU18528]|nr:hypothetical protein CFB35_18390 [Burkholderia sp. AU16482]PHP87961.1 hypothetical protein CFB52_018015 [Burkholderia sp. AU18528]RQX79570.1 hypothetical protein DF034_28560 [Burkholderia anthina]